MEQNNKKFSFEKVAKLDSEHRREHQPPAPVVGLLDLKTGDRILDLGVGTGYFAIPAALELKRLGGGVVVGADLEPRMLDILQERVGEAGVSELISPKALAEDGSPELPFEDSSFDAAMAVNLVHELPDRPASFRELHRVLRGGGLLLIVDWSPGGDPSSGPPGDHRVSSDILAAELSRAGFGDPRAVDVYRDHYVFSVQKTAG